MPLTIKNVNRISAGDNIIYLVNNLKDLNKSKLSQDEQDYAPYLIQGKGTVLIVEDEQQVRTLFPGNCRGSDSNSLRTRGGGVDRRVVIEFIQQHDVRPHALQDFGDLLPGVVPVTSTSVSTMAGLRAAIMAARLRDPGSSGSKTVSL